MDIVTKLQDAMEQKEVEQVYQLFDQFFASIHSATPINELGDFVDYTLHIGFYEEAKRALHILLEREPHESKWTIYLAEIFVQEGAHDQALSILFDIPSTDPNYFNVLLIQALSYSQQGDLDIAEHKLLKAKELNDQEHAIHYFLGEIFLANGKLTRAITSLTTYLQKEPDRVYAFHAKELLIEAYVLNNEYENAYALFETLDREKVSSHVLTLVTNRQIAEQKEQAFDNLSEEMLRNQDSIAGLYNLVQLAITQKKYEQALDYLQAIHEQDPYQEEVYMLQTRIYFSLKQLNQALASAQKWIQVNEDNEVAIAMYATIGIELAQFEHVIEVIQQAQARNVFDPQFHWFLAQAYEGLEQFEQAKKEYEEAAPYYRESIEFLYDYARFLREEGEVKQALALVEKGLTIEPLNEPLVELHAELQEY